MPQQCLKGPTSDWANEAAIDAAGGVPTGKPEKAELFCLVQCWNDGGCLGVPAADLTVVPVPVPAVMPTYQVISSRLNLFHMLGFRPGD